MMYYFKHQVWKKFGGEGGREHVGTKLKMSPPVSTILVERACNQALPQVGRVSNRRLILTILLNSTQIYWKMAAKSWIKVKILI